ncbi:hypothetical protein CRV01_00110 [Arcobacter sp. CECT 8983]|uniref:hypothetical protein n=1 Tax=Arcobacter sp. CECT 8983 TaxID=2044508 RepID=UPI00100BEA16|nr:hypothetical protein [Arcobacter sp. CECT 8983]RXJ91531.1 hypothetical protein CRV01_00110 [Arcobacter sp. CECT 8983]
MGQIPLELISNIISMVILIMLFVKYYQYKKKLDVLKGLNELKEKKKLSQEDKSFISSNLKDYQILLARDEQRIKLAYPVFILIAGILLAFFEFKEAMIHLNVIVVAFIFMQVNKIHNRNFVNLLTELNK